MRIRMNETEAQAHVLIDDSVKSPVSNHLYCNGSDQDKVGQIHETESCIDVFQLDDDSFNRLTECKSDLDHSTDDGEFEIAKNARRNSFPENYRVIRPDSVNIVESGSSFNLNAISVDNHGENLDRTKQIDKKNITEVVKNVHGLFSFVGGSLKNAYKPMEKNFSGMVQATQRNFNMAKTAYNNQKAMESINKYNTLNLSNENDLTDETMFKKCDSLSKVDSEVQIGEIEKPVELSNVFTIDSNKSEDDARSEISVSTNRDESETEDSLDMRKNLDDISENSTADSEMDTATKIENYANKISKLEETIIEQNGEISVLKSALIDKDAIKKNLESKMNLFMKQLETVTADRNASVVRYATSERAALEAIKSKEAALSAEQSAKREVTMITQRLRTANAEKMRATASLDMKCHELSQVQKEVGKLKDELQSCDVKLKWAQSKLVSEMEAHKESSVLVEKLSYQIKQFEGGNMSPAPQTQSDMDALIREKEASIILERHEKERVVAKCKQLQDELDKLKASYTSTTEDMRELRAQVQSSAAESDALRRACSELRDQGAKDCERLAAAQARAARCDTLATHLQQEQEKCSKLMQELESMRVLREEALAESELRIRREAELLRQSERLTAAGVKLQSACSEAEAKALALTVDNTSLREAASRAVSEAAEARAEAGREREGRAADARALAARVAQHARGERETTTLLEAARGEIRILTTKHASAIKELKRELHQMAKKCERYEAEGKILPPLPITKMSSGSTSSISSFESPNMASNISDESAPSTDKNTPDRQQLVERIVSLQRAAARRNEKLDFLEEHNRQLTQELQRKTRLLRNLLVAVPTGGVTSAASDAAKAEIGRHGGVMASVFGSQVTDETMTLDLSLEINAKLQSLLEDTLLSNIMLKENMDTLGDEISKLKKDQKLGKGQK